jgi:hypothetical protein
MVAAKVRHVLETTALGVVLCVGETLDAREAGHTLHTLKRQLHPVRDFQGTRHRGVQRRGQSVQREANTTHTLTLLSAGPTSGIQHLLTRTAWRYIDATGD